MVSEGILEAKFRLANFGKKAKRKINGNRTKNRLRKKTKQEKQHNHRILFLTYNANKRFWTIGQYFTAILSSSMENGYLVLIYSGGDVHTHFVMQNVNVKIHLT